jgi:hypothetical protein
VRPFLLAAGLALMWFALFQDLDVGGDLPASAFAAVLGTRFLVDLVGAWLALSLLRLGLSLGRLAWIRLWTPHQ